LIYYIRLIRLQTYYGQAPLDVNGLLNPVNDMLNFNFTHYQVYF